MATQAKDNLKLVHFEHREWLNKLSFYKVELDTYEKMLGEVAVKNTAHESRAQVEHFQNQFILHREKLDELHHEIGLSENALVEQIKQNAVAWEHQSVGSQSLLRDRMQVFDNLYFELKREYRLFLETQF